MTESMYVRGMKKKMNTIKVTMRWKTFNLEDTWDLLQEMKNSSVCPYCNKAFVSVKAQRCHSSKVHIKPYVEAHVEDDRVSLRRL